MAGSVLRASAGAGGVGWNVGAAADSGASFVLVVETGGSFLDAAFGLAGAFAAGGFLGWAGAVAGGALVVEAVAGAGFFVGGDGRFSSSPR